MPSDGLNQAVDDIVERMPRKKMSGKKIVLMLLVLLLLLGGGAAGLYFSGLLDPYLGMEQPAAEGTMDDAMPEFVEPGVFVDLPDILVNLNSDARRSSFLRISISLELESAEDLPQIEAVMPRIIDQFQVYLREMTMEDLRGSAGLERLREELLRRVNGAVEPLRIRAVLFREMVNQ